MDMPTGMDDDEIIGMYFARDEEALRETDRVYGRDLLRLALRLLGNREDAEENRDDTYLTAWNTIPPVRPRSLAAFLYKICRNHALDRIDSRKTRKRSAVLVELTDELANCIPGGSVEEEIDAKETGRLLSAFLKRLSWEERYIMMARCFQMESIGSIAEVLGSSQGRVRTILYRTRKRLKQYLEENGYEIR